MRTLTKRAVWASVFWMVCAAMTGLATAADNSIVVVMKDGHRESLALAEIARIDLSPPVIIYKDGHKENTAAIDHIEFGPAEAAMTPSRAHFVGKWEVGDGSGNQFFITLDSDGQATKSRGAAHGTWALVAGEARITWDDGWHDVLRKVGSKHEKFAFEPGRSLDESPSNVTDARSATPKPI